MEPFLLSYSQKFGVFYRLHFSGFQISIGNIKSQVQQLHIASSPSPPQAVSPSHKCTYKYPGQLHLHKHIFPLTLIWFIICTYIFKIFLQKPFVTNLFSYQRQKSHSYLILTYCSAFYSILCHQKNKQTAIVVQTQEIDFMTYLWVSPAV